MLTHPRFPLIHFHCLGFLKVCFSLCDIHRERYGRLTPSIVSFKSDCTREIISFCFCLARVRSVAAVIWDAALSSLFRNARNMMNCCCLDRNFQTFCFWRFLLFYELLITPDIFRGCILRAVYGAFMLNNDLLFTFSQHLCLKFPDVARAILHLELDTALMTVWGWSCCWLVTFFCKRCQ